MESATILIVEDDASIRNMYEDAFTAAGVSVLTAGTGKEGIELALFHHPNAILMDINMPDMNGHEAVHTIRKDNWGKGAVIVYLTNMSDAENVVSAVAEGSEEYIIKANTTPKEVVNKVRMAMRA